MRALNFKTAMKTNKATTYKVSVLLLAFTFHTKCMGYLKLDQRNTMRFQQRNVS